MRIEDLFVGQSFSLSKCFTTEEVECFASLSMDDNPIHLKEESAQKSLFDNKIVHGFLTSSLLSAIIGTKLPGYGSIYLKQDLNFRKPVYHNEKVTAEVVVEQIRVDKPIVHLKTTIYKENSEIAVDGIAIVKLTNN